MDQQTRARLVKARLTEIKARRGRMAGAESGYSAEGEIVTDATGRRARGRVNERLLDGGDASIDRREVDKIRLTRASPKRRLRQLSRALTRSRRGSYHAGASGRSIY